MAATKEVAKKEESTALVDNSSMFLEDQNVGMENVGTDDLLIPFLVVLQALSPQVKKKDPQYVEGAEEGMFLETATNTLYDGDTGLLVIPVAYQRRHTEWIPRKKGGGLVNDYGMDDSVLSRCQRKDGRYVTPEGNDLVVSGTHYVFIVDPEKGTYVPAILSLAGTQLKKSRRWNTTIKNMKEEAPKDGKTILFTPASFFWAYRLTSVPESNEKGSWMGVKIDQEVRTVQLPEGMAIYQAARDFRTAVAEGQVKVAAEQEPHSGSGAEESDDDVPF